jgi:hypothetical protein
MPRWPLTAGGVFLLIASVVDASAQTCAELQQEYQARVNALISGTGFGFDAANAARISQLQAILPNCRDAYPQEQQPQRYPEHQQPQQTEFPVNCGDYSCRDGYYCGSRNSCLADGSNDCGNGRSCPGESKCARSGQKCLPKDTVDCGSFFCAAGGKCGSGNKCLAENAVDCGGGRACPRGTLCVRGGAECLSREEIAQRAAAEKRKREEEAATRKREAEERKAAEQKRLEEAREAARRKEEEQKREIARKKEEAEAKRKAAAEAKRQAVEAQAKRKAHDAARKKARFPEAAGPCVEVIEIGSAVIIGTPTEITSPSRGVASGTSPQTGAAPLRTPSPTVQSPTNCYNFTAASTLTSDLMAKLPIKAVSESIRSAVQMTLSNGLAVAIPVGLNAKQKMEAMNELTAMWNSKLSKANFGPIAGGFAGQAVKDVVVAKSATFVGGLVADTVAKRTSNTFVIEFFKASTELAIIDAAAAKKGGLPAVLVANFAKIGEAAIGLHIDANSAAKSMRAYEVQVNDIISRAQREQDPSARMRLVRVANNALKSLHELRKEHPTINTLSTMSVEGTVETLRSWAPQFSAR